MNDTATLDRITWVNTGVHFLHWCSCVLGVPACLLGNAAQVAYESGVRSTFGIEFQFDFQFEILTRDQHPPPKPRSKHHTINTK